MQLNLKARAIFDLLKRADLSKSFVTSEALVNTTWLSRHGIEMTGSDVILKRWDHMSIFPSDTFIS